MYELRLSILKVTDTFCIPYKKLKENVQAIQVGCQTCGGAPLDKECPLNKEIKSMKEVNYEKFGRPFPKNNRNDGRFNRGALGYDQPSSRERRPSLTDIINKYMEEEAKRHAEQDKRLKKFYLNTKINREAHEKIIQGLEIKVKTLANEVEGRTNVGKLEEKIQPDEFIDCLNTVERIFDYQDVLEDVKKLSVEEYTEQFDRFMLRCGIVEPEEKTIARYLRGLHKEIYDVLTLQPFISYNDVFKLATKIEKQLKEKETWKSTNYGFSRVLTLKYSTNRGSGSQSTKLATSKSFLMPPNQEEGAAGPSPSKSKAVQCFKCKVFDEPSEHEDVIYGDTRELLVIQRALAMDSIEDDVWLRHNIFHTRCTSLGKVCDVIIDSESCENVVSETMVKKLSLKTEKHPRPYKLSWLQKGKSVQFDRRIIHDDLKNTYSFDKDGEGLPPMRTVQHCLDLIPGATLPNKPACRMNPTESAELQRQVDELLKKGMYEFMTHSLVFLGYVISEDGIHVDSAKVDATVSWPTPTSLHEIRSFHGMASFYRRFIRNFITLVSPITECLKRGNFIWTKEAQASFERIKARMTEAPVLALPNFKKVFELDCDASGVRIGVVLSQDKRPVAFFSKKLSKSRQKYTTYEKEFYAIVRALEHWRHYLISKDFILHSGHEALTYINGQHKLKPRHARWVEFLQAYTFHIKHKSGVTNKVANSLSRRSSFLSTMKVNVHGFEIIKELYKEDKFLSKIIEQCSNGPYKEFVFQDVFLFHGNQLCIPDCSIRLEIIKEAHEEKIKELHEQVKGKIEKQNQNYAKQANKHRKLLTFKVGNLLWIHMSKERFPHGQNAKLKQRGDGPFRIVQCMGDNAYKVELPGHYRVSATFNVKDLSPFHEENELNSRTSFLTKGNDTVSLENRYQGFKNSSGPREIKLGHFGLLNTCY
nr:hypothetical protein [Tanacetum cinerariifolium]